MSRASYILSLVEDDGEFAKRRGKSVDLKKDWSRSNASKRSGNRNRLTNQWATKRSSHSPSGRKRHRKIGRLLATTIGKRSSAMGSDDE